MAYCYRYAEKILLLPRLFLNAWLLKNVLLGNVNCVINFFLNSIVLTRKIANNNFCKEYLVLKKKFFFKLLLFTIFFLKKKIIK